MPRGAEFARWNRELDQAAYGPVWLRDDRVAEKLLYGESGRNFYELKAGAIMPNHVHMVILPKRELPTIMRWIKGSAARATNLILGRAGQAFWQAESLDHRVKDSAGVIRYIEYNRVNAGFVKTPDEWNDSGARWAGESACPTL